MRKQIIQKTKNSTNVGVEILIGKEGNYSVVYCPALELSSYGETDEEAQRNFEVELRIFLEETEKRGTLEKILLKLGWCLTHQPKPNYRPPQNPQVSIPLTQSRSYTETVALPL